MITAHRPVDRARPGSWLGRCSVRIFCVPPNGTSGHEERHPGSKPDIRRRKVAAMPAPHWFFRFMYDRESAAWDGDATRRRIVSWSSGSPMSSRTWSHRPDQWPTSAAGLARTRSLSRGAVTTSPVSTGHRASSRSRGHGPPATRSSDVRRARRQRAAPLRGRVAGRCPRDPRPTAPPASRGLLAEIRRCLRPGGHLLITAPARDSTSLTSQHLYWRLRAACCQLVPGLVRFYDTNSLPVSPRTRARPSSSATAAPVP